MATEQVTPISARCAASPTRAATCRPEAPELPGGFSDPEEMTQDGPVAALARTAGSRVRNRPLAMSARRPTRRTAAVMGAALALLGCLLSIAAASASPRDQSG